jgi:RHS repeat-associated protein
MIFSGSQRILAKPIGSSSLYFYHGDHLGSTSVVTDSTGTQVQALTYYPFGQTRTNVPGTPINVAHKYTGKELDNATGLYWYEWRSYDPVLARFLVPDTIVPSPQDPQGLNRYSYVTNNPLRYTDPTGHFRLNVSKFLRTSLGPIGSQIVIAAVAITAAYFTAGAASSAFLGAFNVAVGPPTLAMATAASAVGGVAGGAVGGGIAGGLQGGNFNRVLSGAIGGGVSGGVFGGLGPLTSGWDYAARGATYGVAGGASSAARGGSFTRGLVSSLAVSTLTSAALSMRHDMVEQSRLNPENAGGESEGANGDRFKLGGVRWVEGAEEQPFGRLLGGRQGGQGYLFGIPYSPGSFGDHLVETFAGPHDFMNSFTWYNHQGNALPLTGIPAFGGEILDTANVFLAAPFAAASVIPEYAYPLLGRR